jgi:hypothetical protein
LLRKHYGDKIDEIAMTFGVQQAIETRDEVERTVVVPVEVKPSANPKRRAKHREYTEEDLGL